ncbi:MAG: TPR repeat protein [Candidatus Methanoperedens nitroreducens]|uniref:TPR repeat protein n=1 Tax=Candidatus Methanoperedens nitratireducens TaxID=1392998 RepID=A0A0P8E0S3_9EURY|nr:MAG: TPR repeat protein [Candidatus Methanoperedens sp. BLZ1]
MTNDDEEMTIENKIVVSFDICSSSSIIEDLTLTNNLKALRNLLINMKEFMRKRPALDFEVYKFTGDGWILLFPENIQGNGLMSFLILLSSFFKEELTSSIIPLLESPPEIMGLTFGIDGGKLIKIVMNENKEYIGRPLNIACRLQSAIKDKDDHPENKILVSKHVFNRYLKSLKGYNPENVSRTLRNIRGGERYQCVMIPLPSSLVMQFPLQFESTFVKQPAAPKARYEDIIFFDKMLKIDPKNVSALNNKGTILNNSFKRYKDAIECFDKILEIYPKNVLALVNKSMALYNWGNDLLESAKMRVGKEKEELLIQSIEKYKLALSTKSDKYDAANNWGIALSELAKVKEGKEKEELLKKSIEKYELAFRIKPDFYQGIENSAMDLEELAKMKKGKEKEELLKQSIEKREMANEFKKKILA